MCDCNFFCKILCTTVLVVAFLFNTLGNWIGVGDIIPTESCPFDWCYEETTEEESSEDTSQEGTTAASTTEVTEPSTEDETTTTTTTTATTTTTTTTLPTTTTTRYTTTQPPETDGGPQLQDAAQIALTVFGGASENTDENGNDIINGVAPTSDGGFVVCGTTESKSGTFAKVYDSSWKRPYSFVAKFSKTGTMSWVKGFGSSSAPVTLSDVTVLSNGTIIAVGYTKATDYAANKDSSGSVDAIILKLNSSNGYMSMKKSFGGKNTDMFTCVEATGTTFVAGGKSYSTTHDFAHLEGESAILMSFNANLAKQWQTQLHGSAASNISDIAVDSNGSIFATCLTAATDGDFAGYKNSGGYTDTLVLKYDGSGNKIWSRMISSTGRDEFGNIAPDGKGGCVVAGYYELLANQTPDGSLKGIHHCGGIDALVFRLNDDGTQRWVKTLSGLEDDFITDIVKVKNGFAVTGYTASSNREFAQTGNEGLYDGFVSFVNTNGVTVNTLTQAGTQDDMAECLVYTALGEVYGMGKTKSVDTDFKDINPYTEQTYMGYIAKFTVE